MLHTLNVTPEALADLNALATDKGKKAVSLAVFKSLRLMTQDLRHPGLRIHEFHSRTGPSGEKVWESYAGSWRIFWCYGPGKDQLTILAITEHP